MKVFSLKSMPQWWEPKNLVRPVLIAALFTLALKPITDPDFFWHLATGELIVRSGRIPRRDPFSYTVQGKGWVCHEWLTEVIMYAIHCVLGQPGLILTFAAVAAATFALLYVRCCRRAGNDSLVAASVTVLAALASSPTWGVRPQMVSVLLANIFLYRLEAATAGHRSRWLFVLVPLQALWANLHGAFPAGIALMVTYIVANIIDDILLANAHGGPGRRRHLAMLVPLTLAAVLAALLNPYGRRMVAYPLETLASPAMREHIAEWASPNFHELRFQPLALLLLGLIAALAFSQVRLATVDGLLLAGTAYAALSSARHIPFFTLAAAPVLAQAVHEGLCRLRGAAVTHRIAEPARKELPQRVAMALGAILVVAQVAATGTQLSRVGHANEVAQRAHYPVAALEQIRQEGIEGHVLNTYRWGGYLIWRGYPVFIDGRADVYGDRFLTEYVDVYKGRKDYRDLVNDYRVDYALLEPDAPLATLLRQAVNWEKVYEDEVAVVFTRWQVLWPGSCILLQEVR